MAPCLATVHYSGIIMYRERLIIIISEGVNKKFYALAQVKVYQHVQFHDHWYYCYEFSVFNLNEKNYNIAFFIISHINKMNSESENQMYRDNDLANPYIHTY